MARPIGFMSKAFTRIRPIPMLFRITVLLAAISSFAHASEPRMTKIVSRMIGPKVVPGPFQAKPKTLYIADHKYARVEEALDVKHRIHALIITDEPHSWMINLADNTGRHLIDPGPTFVMRTPIIWVAKPKGQSDPDKEFRDLEYGNEAEFFRAHQAREISPRNLEGKNYKVFSLKNSTGEVLLLVDPDTGKPYQIDLIKNGKLDFSVRYLSYETNLPFEKSLFEPPKGIKITEGQ